MPPVAKRSVGVGLLPAEAPELRVGVGMRLAPDVNEPAPKG